MVYFSIVIPCHNEEISLPKLYIELEKYLKIVSESYEVLLVNDSSTDGTKKIMNEISSKNSKFKSIHLKKRSGQTGSFREAFKKAKGTYIMRMDGDLQDHPKFIPAFVEKMKENYDIIVGIREARKHSRVLRFISHVYNALIILFFNSPFHEASSSYIAFKSKYLKGLKLAKNDHRYLVVLTYLQGIKKPGEIITMHNQRVGGKSKYVKWKKLFFGFFELMMVLIRIKIGYYKPKL